MEPGRNDDDVIAARKSANIRLAIYLALVALAVYLGFIVSHL